MTDISWLAGTKWYVPPQNLLAYLCDTALRHEQAVADQTVWSIASAADGRFEGTSETRLRAAAGDGFKELGTTTNSMSGTIGEGGEITIVFTPEDAGQAQTIGYGQLRQVEDAWRMEMQMATGTSLLALHWAYMTQWEGDTAGPEAPHAFPDPALRSDEWRWMEGTAWTAMDEELFPQGSDFTIGSYRNGYFWGDGTVAGGDSLRVAGSVTPEGMLYILFSIDAEPAVARRGSMQITGDARRMTWTATSGGAIAGTATER